MHLRSNIWIPNLGIIEPKVPNLPLENVAMQFGPVWSIKLCDAVLCSAWPILRFNMRAARCTRIFITYLPHHHWCTQFFYFLHQNDTLRFIWIICKTWCTGILIRYPTHLADAHLLLFRIQWCTVYHMPNMPKWDIYRRCTKHCWCTFYFRGMHLDMYHMCDK